MLRPGLEHVIGEMDCPPLANIGSMRINIVDDIWLTFQPGTRDQIRLVAYLPKGRMTQEVVLQATRDTRTELEDLIRRLDQDGTNGAEDSGGEARDSAGNDGLPGEHDEREDEGSGEPSVPTEAEEQSPTT